MEAEALEFARSLFPRNEIGSARLDEDFSHDIDLNIGPAVFPCHRRVLISQSEFFEIMFNGNFKEANERAILLPAEYVNIRTFPKLLRAMYGEPLEIKDEDVESLIVSCSYLQLTQFMDECEQYIRSNCSTINFSKLIVLPQLRECKSLYEFVIKYCSKNFGRIYPRLKKIPIELLKELFASEHMMIWSRRDALKFHKLWLSRYQKERRERYERSIKDLFITPCQELMNKGPVVEKYKTYMRNNFDSNDMVEFYTRSCLDDPLHVTAKHYICQYFSNVSDRNEMKQISYEKIVNLLSEPVYFNLNYDTICKVIYFCHAWLKFDHKGRKMYKAEIQKLESAFRWRVPTSDRTNLIYKFRSKKNRQTVPTPYSICHTRFTI